MAKSVPTIQPSPIHQPRGLAGPAHRHINQLAPQLLVARPKPLPGHEQLAKGAALGVVHRQPRRRTRGDEDITHTNNGAAPSP